MFWVALEMHLCARPAPLLYTRRSAGYLQYAGASVMLYIYVPSDIEDNGYDFALS